MVNLDFLLIQRASFAGHYSKLTDKFVMNNAGVVTTPFTFGIKAYDTFSATTTLEYLGAYRDFSIGCEHSFSKKFKVSVSGKSITENAQTSHFLTVFNDTMNDIYNNRNNYRNNITKGKTIHNELETNIPSDDTYENARVTFKKKGFEVGLECVLKESGKGWNRNYERTTVKGSLEYYNVEERVKYSKSEDDLMLSDSAYKTESINYNELNLGLELAQVYDEGAFFINVSKNLLDRKGGRIEVGIRGEVLVPTPKNKRYKKSYRPNNYSNDNTYFNAGIDTGYKSVSVTPGKGNDKDINTPYASIYLKGKYKGFMVGASGSALPLPIALYDEFIEDNTRNESSLLGGSNKPSCADVSGYAGYEYEGNNGASVNARMQIGHVGDMLVKNTEVGVNQYEYEPGQEKHSVLKYGVKAGAKLPIANIGDSQLRLVGDIGYNKAKCTTLHIDEEGNSEVYTNKYNEAPLTVGAEWNKEKWTVYANYTKDLLTKNDTNNGFKFGIKYDIANTKK
jgi:hypothetical protein